jgi:hypothetical protein
MERKSVRRHQGFWAWAMNLPRRWRRRDPPAASKRTWRLTAKWDESSANRSGGARKPSTERHAFPGGISAITPAPGRATTKVFLINDLFHSHGNLRWSGQSPSITIYSFLTDALLWFVKAQLFNSFDLHHPRIMNRDLHRPELQRADMLPHQLQPGRQRILQLPLGVPTIIFRNNAHSNASTLI